jgi:hypothetical protein
MTRTGVWDVDVHVLDPPILCGFPLHQRARPPQISNNLADKDLRKESRLPFLGLQPRLRDE